MKVRDSGMPEQAYWETLFDVAGILDRLKIDSKIESAVEVGCGYGTFTVPVAQRISGTLHAYDIEPLMIDATEERLRTAGVNKVKLTERDVIASGFALPTGSADAVLLFNILHAENPVALLRASGDLLRPKGRVLVIHWRSDIPTPRGPDLSIRPRAAQVRDWARRTGILACDEPEQILPPWHFGLMLPRI